VREDGVTRRAAGEPLPTILAVDFYRRGDLLDVVVDELSGL
jgi:hypothetical protein